MKFASTFCTRDESAWHESTRDPIFLVLVETAQLLDYDEDVRPQGWFRNDDGDLCIAPTEGECSCHLTPPCGFCTDTRHATFDEIKALRDSDIPITIETRVESVWLTRQEAESWVKSHPYRFTQDQHVYVYCLCAEGELREVLKDGTVGSAPKGYPRREGTVTT